MLGIVNDIMTYEDGELNEEDSIVLFQKLIDSGQVWTLQGHYGHTAKYLIEQGLCTCLLSGKS